MKGHVQQRGAKTWRLNLPPNWQEDRGQYPLVIG